ncbi:hypothetical protein GE09DRAFT_363136 [Coniochaeta sp. 2T2.1]|nr:hypothetical protein GE09DRAFT_363136 [Coniochaeta sp. 2T2.1]
MMFFSMKTIVTCLVAATCARAHMFLASPVRFIQDPVVTNGPLLADGTNFPCQAGSTGKYTVKEMNVYPLGSQQTIAFVGGAVHAGGSGQALLTYDTAPRPDSVFKVLKSFEGGFVAKGQTGNIGNDANAPDPYTYTFDIPKDLPAGNATVAITWFNKVGNREMYMMCAPVTVTGNGGSQASFDALPDMFTANIGRGCGTQDSTDVVFPDPGQVVERNNGATTAFASPTGSGCKTGPGGARLSGTAGPTGSSIAGPAVSGVPAAGYSNNGGTFATTSAQAAPPASTAPSSSAPGFSGSYSITASGAATTKAPAPATTSAAPPSGHTTAAASGSGSVGALTGPCTTEGEFNCIDGPKYQQCGSGRWSVAMPVAPGTKCAVGRGGSLNVVPVKKLRFMGRRFDA